MALTLPLLAKRLARTDRYIEYFDKAFGSKPNVFDMSKAMEQFLLTLVSKDSRFNGFFPGKFSLLSESEKRGALLYNGLVELDNDLKVQPCIAKSWTISPDGLVYTFFLNQGVMFHDHEVFPSGKGRESTADDFVYSFKRIIDSSSASPGAWIFNDKVRKEKNGRISDTCFKANGKYELKIYLEQPFPAFLEILAMPYAFVIPKEIVTKSAKD